MNGGESREESERPRAAEGGATAEEEARGANPPGRPAPGRPAGPGAPKDGAVRSRAAASNDAGPPALSPAQAAQFEKIREALPFVERDERTRGALGLSVPPDRLLETLAALKTLPGVAVNHLSSVSAVDWKDAIEVAYHLFNLDDPDVRIVVKVRLPYQGDEEPEVDSVVDLWEAANWHEREAYDLLGVRFRGHPDLRRILLPETYQGGHPLRKTFVDRRPKRQRLVRPR